MICLFQSLMEHDTVRECLEKDPADRTEDDIEILLEFMQHLPVRPRIKLCLWQGDKAPHFFAEKVFLFDTSATLDIKILLCPCIVNRLCRAGFVNE